MIPVSCQAKRTSRCASIWVVPGSRKTISVFFIPLFISQSERSLLTPWLHELVVDTCLLCDVLGPRVPGPHVYGSSPIAIAAGSTIIAAVAAGRPMSGAPSAAGSISSSSGRRGRAAEGERESSLQKPPTAGSEHDKPFFVFFRMRRCRVCVWRRFGGYLEFWCAVLPEHGHGPLPRVVTHPCRSRDDKERAKEALFRELGTDVVYKTNVVDHRRNMKTICVYPGWAVSALSCDKARMSVWLVDVLCVQRRFAWIALVFLLRNFEISFFFVTWELVQHV